jgi:hypothetical protein
MPTPSHYTLELFKTTSNVVVVDERALDGPEGLTTETTVYIGVYTHPGQTGLPSDIGPPHELLTTSPPPHSRYPSAMTRMRPSTS